LRDQSLRWIQGGSPSTCGYSARSGWCGFAGNQRLYGLDVRGLRPVQEWVGGFERFCNEILDRLDEYARDLRQQAGGAVRLFANKSVGSFHPC
jgi:hypothetical protein